MWPRWLVCDTAETYGNVFPTNCVGVNKQQVARELINEIIKYQRFVIFVWPFHPLNFKQKRTGAILSVCKELKLVKSKSSLFWLTLCAVSHISN